MIKFYKNSILNNDFFIKKTKKYKKKLKVQTKKKIRCMSLSNPA
jgi:hypothetical protein